MQKFSLLSSVLLSSLLLNTGCTQKETIEPIIATIDNSSIPSSTVEETPKEITSPTEIESPKETISSTPIPVQEEGKSRQMKTVQGETITVNQHSRGFGFPEYRDKIVLVQIFGKECRYCFEEMPVINKIQERFQNRLSVIAIQGQSPMTQQKAQELISQHNMNYPIIDQDEAKSILVFLRDVYNWRGILPYILLIKNGQIEQVFKGADNSFEKISQGINDIP